MGNSEFQSVNKSQPGPGRIILASQSPRRRELLRESGYEFEVELPSESAESALPSATTTADQVETPAKLVARLARQKAQDVAERTAVGIIVGCDTVAECCGQTLGKPNDREHARAMLELLRGKEHRVWSGLCIWRRPDNEIEVQSDLTLLYMDQISDAEVESYLESGQWIGKAGAFGYQDRLGWVHIVAGSESNVVGLPMELLERMLTSSASTPSYERPRADSPLFHVTLHYSSSQPLVGSTCVIKRVSIGTISSISLERQETFDVTFEQVVESLNRLPSMFVEMDGSFTWGSLPNEKSNWRLDGNLYEHHNRLGYIEVKGSCSIETWRRLLRHLLSLRDALSGRPVDGNQQNGANTGHLVVQWIELGIFTTAAEFERWLTLQTET